MDMDKDYYVYVLARQRNGTLYAGVTSNLIKRIWEHNNNAIKRENRLKKYNRQWKLRLIEKENPGWRDLYTDLVSGLPDRVGQ